MTPSKLTEIRERVEKATKGPWYVAGDWTVLTKENCGDVIANMSRLEQHKENANFVAHARTDIPALLDEITRLNEMVRDKSALEAALNIRVIYMKCPECECYLESEGHEEFCPHKLTEDQAREGKDK